MTRQAAKQETPQQDSSHDRGRIVVFSGPSGVGKGTLLKEVLRQSALPLEMSVSATTRPPRPGEQNGVEYHFLSLEDFQKRRENGEFLECFEVFQSGYWYGTLRNEVESRRDAGKWVVLEIDVQGGLAVQKLCPDAVMIFIRPKSIEVLKERLAKRGTESSEAVSKRLQQATEELELAKYYTYQLVNDDLQTAVGQLNDLLLNIAKQKNNHNNEG